MFIAKSTFFQLASRIVTSGTTLILTIVIASHFGVFGFGNFTKITAYIGLFYIIVDFGMNAFYLQKSENEKHFFQLLFLRLSLSFVLVFLAVIVSIFLPFFSSGHGTFFTSLRFGLIIFSLSIINQGLVITSSSLFQKFHRYDYLLQANILGSLAALLFVGAALYFSASLNTVLFGIVLGGFVSAFLSLFFLREWIHVKKIDYSFIKPLIKESFPFGLMLFLNLVYFRFDMLILSTLRSTEEVGIYGFAYKFFDFLIALPLFLSNALYPSLLAWGKNKRTLAIQVKKNLFLFSILGIIIAIAAWIFAPFMTLINADFYPSILPLRILLISLPFFFISNFAQWVLVALKQQKYLLKIYLLLAIVNIIFNILYIPLFGYIASAAITAISEGIILIFLLYKIMQIQKITQNETKI